MKPLSGETVAERKSFSYTMILHEINGNSELWYSYTLARMVSFVP